MAKIDKNIRYSGPIGKSYEWQELLTRMEDGDSILLGLQDGYNFSNYCKYRATEFDFPTKKEGDMRRVWKLRKPSQGSEVP